MFSAAPMSSVAKSSFIVGFIRQFLSELGLWLKTRFGY